MQYVLVKKSDGATVGTFANRQKALHKGYQLYRERFDRLYREAALLGGCDSRLMARYWNVHRAACPFGRWFRERYEIVTVKVQRELEFSN
jgi:cyclopropane fatty-acyl-phospholipid synthase-like methyltransferase